MVGDNLFIPGRKALILMFGADVWGWGVGGGFKRQRLMRPNGETETGAGGRRGGLVHIMVLILSNTIPVFKPL